MIPLSAWARWEGAKRERSYQAARQRAYGLGPISSPAPHKSKRKSVWPELAGMFAVLLAGAYTGWAISTVQWENWLATTPCQVCECLEASPEANFHPPLFRGISTGPFERFEVPKVVGQCVVVDVPYEDGRVVYLLLACGTGV